MKKYLLSLVILFSVTCIKAQTYNFTSVDSLLNANLNSVFRNKVVCMVMHNDSLIYYYNRGADSLTTGGIASCTKTFSAALMLRLVQEGTIHLDDSIAQYYPFTTALGKGAITLRQLFAHTSGLSGSTQFNASTNINLQQSADSILTNDVLTYTPIGTKFLYTGEDQQVAGAAAELAAGMSWNNLFETKIAQPLGLDTTYFYLTTPNNPRVAGGIKTNSVDMLRFGQFILHNGKNSQGLQVVDSVLMQELWQDQTNHAFQVASPYPNSIPNNNPYNADTIYYGIGTWLDIFNPAQQYQEQISADGAFGGIIWVNRCTNMTGVFLTFLPSLGTTTHPVQWQIMDIFRNAVPFTCYTTTQVNEIQNINSNFIIYPNPAQQTFTVELQQNNFDVTITDITGSKIYENKNVFSKTLISSKGFMNGIYFIHVKTDKNHFTQKLIIQQ